ncbi:TetR/AcrR family transcriptional regulator [Micromonospora rifamycinica]|uniref:TetR/AcrR family transcriptional regulator n=1 Tax=Micromonospora rifamycinica TaxID=291594 RepID=UPI002E294F2C|nr:TetR family transcriptional regulator [Micromonospora rifamycinica]
MTDGGRRSARSAATRERLVAATAELIAELGWGNVSTRRVAERAGVNPGLIHYHVSSIDELRRAAAVQGVLAFFQGPIQEALTEVDPYAAVAGLLAALSPADPRDPHLLLLYESLVAAGRDEQLRRQIAPLLAELRRLLRDWLTDHLVPEPDAVAVTITAAIDGYLLQRALDPSLPPGPLITGLSRLFRLAP